MRTHIDWLTFTFTPTWVNSGTQEYLDALNGGLVAQLGVELMAEVFDGKVTKKEKSRAPYTDCWTFGEGWITLFASPNLNHATVEISGRGCELLISHGFLDALLAKTYDRVTRIDIASDIETTTSPIQFTGVMSHERMRANGYQKSETGETCYVGSQKSDRYARVYRYADPHPRAHLLRVEHVFRKDYAKQVSWQCVGGDLEAVALSAGRAMGWKHGDWQPSSSDPVNISVVRESRVTGKTVHWLVTSCASAFKRLCADGTIKDPEAFLRRYFFPQE